MFTEFVLCVYKSKSLLLHVSLPLQTLEVHSEARMLTIFLLSYIQTEGLNAISTLYFLYCIYLLLTFNSAVISELVINEKQIKKPRGFRPYARIKKTFYVNPSKNKITANISIYPLQSYHQCL